MNWLDGRPDELRCGGVFRLQWVWSALKEVQSASVLQGDVLPVKHPVLVPLLQSLGEDSAQVVQSCCHVLVKASTEQGWVCHRQVLHELVSRAAVSPSFSVLLEAATSLMIHDMNTATPTKYSIRINEHPYLSLLENRPEAGSCVIRQVLAVLATHNLSRSSVELVTPVIKYLLLHPAPPTYIASLLHNLYPSLCLLISQHPGAPPSLLMLLARLLPYQIITGVDQLLSVSHCACTLTPFLSKLPAPFQQGMLTHLLLLSVETTLHGLPVQKLLQALEVIVQDTSHEEEVWQPHHGVGVGWLLLQHTTFPATSLLLQLVRRYVCSSGVVVEVISRCLVLPLLQLLSLQPLLPGDMPTKHNLSLAKDLLDTILSSQTTPTHRMMSTPVFVNPDITCCSSFFSNLVFSTHEYLRVSASPSLFTSWLQDLSEPDSLRRRTSGGCGHLAMLVGGMAVFCSCPPAELKAAVRLMSLLSQQDPAITPSVLHFLLHLLGSAQATPSKLTILYTLPNLPSHQRTLGGVVSTFDLISRHVCLLPVALRLMCRLWANHNTAYPYLKAVLTRPLPVSATPSEGIAREIALAKIAVVRDICRTRAELHGEEMLAFISKTLSFHYEDAAVVAMALEGVVSLCHSEVVDVVTVWSVLGRDGKLTSDLRPAVRVAVCPLLALAADFSATPSPSHELFKETALTALWRGVFCEVSEVSASSLQALTNFKMEDLFCHHLPASLQQLLEGRSGDQSHDLGPVPLTGEACVQLVRAVPPGALSAYSLFLVGLLKVELANIPRGVVHTAMKKAGLVLVQETSLRAWLTRLRSRLYATWNKASPTGRIQPLSTEDREALPTKKATLAFFAACEGLVCLRVLPGESMKDRDELLQSGETKGGRGKKEGVVVDLDMAVLKCLVAYGKDLLLDLETVPLWEGVASLSFAHSWKNVQHICLKLYELRLGAVKFKEAPSPAQRQQAHSWVLARITSTIEDVIGKCLAPWIGAFFVLVGVASFCPPKMVMSAEAESLLLDLIRGCQGQLTGIGSGKSYGHSLVKLIMESGHAQLKQAVLVVLPVLFGAARGMCGGCVSEKLLGPLLGLLYNTLDIFTSCPSWYTAVILSKLLTAHLPLYHQRLRPLLDKLHPFLEEASHTSSLQLLSLAAPFLMTLLVAMPTRQDPAMVHGLYTTLGENLKGLDSDLLSSPVGELCTYHYATATGAMFASGLLSQDQATSAISLLVSIVTAVPSPSNHYSVGVALQSLSAHAHRKAGPLTEDIVARWLEQLTRYQDEEVLEAVLVGLVGVVGCGLWEETVNITSHVTMLQNMTYLLVEASNKLVEDGGVYISGLAGWVRVQTALRTLVLCHSRERVPGDLSYLPSTSSLRAIFQFLTEVKESKEEEMSGTKIITSLVCAMGRSLSQWPLPPADYSSLLLPVLDVTESEMMAAGVQVLCGGRGGHVSLLLYLTSPTVFPFLPDSAQLLLLAELPVFISALVEGGRCSEFLHGVVDLVSRDYLTRADLTRALVKGLGRVMPGEGGVSQAVVGAAGCAATQLYVCLSEAVAKDIAGGRDTWERILTYLVDTSLWAGLASCLTSLEDGGCGSYSAMWCALTCAGVCSSTLTFSSLFPVLSWLLRQPLVGGGGGGGGEAAMILHLLLRTLSLSCCSSCSKPSQLQHQHQHQLQLQHQHQHQAELLTFLREWSGQEKEEAREEQWRLFLLLVFSGCGVPLSSGGCGVKELSQQVDGFLCSMFFSWSAVPDAESMKEKLCQCLLNGLVACATNQMEKVKNQFLSAVMGLVKHETYRKSSVWKTVANLI